MRRTSRSDRDTLAKVRTEIRQLEVRAAQFERASSPGIVALRRLIVEGDYRLPAFVHELEERELVSILLQW